MPALFERTLSIDEWRGEKSQLRWIFTGPMGGITVEIGAGRVRLAQRYFDSPGLSKVPPVAERPARHPEGLWEESSVEFAGDLRAITVLLDQRLSVRVALNGKEALVAHCTLDVNRHQVAYSGEEGGVRGRLLPPAIEAATVRVDASARSRRAQPGRQARLVAPDAEHGFVPAATSHQLRVYGAYSRRIREGMTRVQAASSNPQLLATAFSGNAGARTLVMLNRSAAAQRFTVTWPGEAFRYMEVVSPQQENAVEPAAAG